MGNTLEDEKQSVTWKETRPNLSECGSFQGHRGMDRSIGISRDRLQADRPVRDPRPGRPARPEPGSPSPCQRIPRDVAERIVKAKRAHPSWGPKKLVAWLRSGEPDVAWPAPSTASGRTGPVWSRRKRRRRSSPWDEARRPNDVWSIDFKGWFRTGDGTRIDPLTTQDAASRYLLVCEGLERPRRPRPGAPWSEPSASTAFPGLSAPTTARPCRYRPGQPLSAGRLVGQAGYRPQRIEPGRPEQNGRLERLHRTLKAETASPPMANRKRQRRAFDRFRQSYNFERPMKHWGSGLRRCTRPRSAPTYRQTPGVRNRGHGSPRARQRCDQVEGKPHL